MYRIHLGPVMQGWGSWEWLGQSMILAFERYAEVTTFNYDQEPPNDGAVIIIKHPPPPTWWKSLPPEIPAIYAPVDFYESLRDIDAHAPWLIQLKHVVVHSHRLLPYFLSYVPVTYLDHQLRFIHDEMIQPNPDGPVLWIGVHTSLPPLIDWLGSHRLPRPLHILTNLDPCPPADLGFNASHPIVLQRWSPERHLAILKEVSGALDIKGSDFRSRHKPPTKALDYLAAGLPVALESNSSSAEYLRSLGFQVEAPDSSEWFSGQYLASCHQFGQRLRSTHHATNLASHWWKIISELL